MADEYQYYYASHDGKYKGGPYRTIGALKSGVQTSRYGSYWDRENQRYHCIAEDGLVITRYKVIREEDWKKEWKI